MTRQVDEERDRALTLEHARLSGLFGFTPEADASASVPVGWRKPGQPFGGVLICLRCAPIQPTADHTIVFRESYLAAHPCQFCGRRLDETTAP